MLLFECVESNGLVSNERGLLPWGSPLVWWKVSKQDRPYTGEVVLRFGLVEACRELMSYRDI